jgi:unsaturated rhamnogalacturonyl hydrolase
MTIAPQAATKELVSQVAARTMQLHFRMWRFGESIALRGLINASRMTGDAGPLAYSMALLRAYLASGVAKSPLEHVAPATELVMAYEITGETQFLDAAKKRAEMHAGCPQNTLGARCHRTDLSGWDRQIWVDCMDLDPPFLAKLGSVTSEGRYFDQSAGEALAYCRSLQDEETGLLFHGFEEYCGRNGQIWARGNGWAVMGLVETLKYLPREHGDYQEIQQRLHTLCQALTKYQHTEGLWHTLVLQDETYLESTLATMVAFALRESFAASILHEAEFGEMERRARSAVLQRVSADGALSLVSDATPIGEIKMYASRPFGEFPWGQGSLLLMITQEV